MILADSGYQIGYLMGQLSVFGLLTGLVVLIVWAVRRAFRGKGKVK